MALKIDAGKSVLENLVALVNATNAATNLALTAAQVTFGNPSARTPDANPNNTSIVVSPVNGQGYAAGDVTITYTRLNLDQGVAGGAGTYGYNVNGNDATAEASLLAAVATGLGLVPGEFVIDAGTPLSSVTQNGIPTTIDLVPATNSKLYNAGTSIQVTWPEAPEPTLDDAIVNKQQDGFEAA